MRRLLICAALLLRAASAQPTVALGQVITHDTVDYRKGETGHVSNLGVNLEVRPEVTGAGLINFYAHASYQDPGLPNSAPVEFLAWTIYPGICPANGAARDLGTHSYVNNRGARFAVFLKLQCKSTPVSQSALAYVPYLDVALACSDLTKELRFLDLTKNNHLFDISPAGVIEQVTQPIQTAVNVGRTAYQIYSVVSTILDGLSLVSGTLTIARFVVRQVIGSVTDQIVDAGFKYISSQGTVSAQFRNAGWSVMCLVCGERFVRPTLAEGEILECPRPDCRTRATVHFAH